MIEYTIVTMLLDCQNVSKAFIEENIIQDVSFHIEDTDKLAIVGINGAGKTTLLNIIAGELAPDSGLIVVSKGKTIGYLKQNHNVDGANTIYDELLSTKADLIRLENEIRDTELEMKEADGHKLEQLLTVYTRLTHEFEFAGGYIYRSEITGVLKGLGFLENEFDKSIATLSGGQKTRIALGKLLLTKPDLILLDEPTNHLDISAISWLETYLQNYKGAVIIVSHDRYFLDRISNKVVELSNTKAKLYNGNYTAYSIKKEKQRADMMKAYLNQQQVIAKQEAVITKLRQFNREKHIKRANSREKQLAKMDLIDKPELEADEMRIELNPSITSGKNVLEIVGLSKSFGNLNLFYDVNLSIRRGEHVAIVGANGTGKTTLLKILNQQLEADKGFFTLGTNVHIGYYDQDQLILDESKTLIMEISDSYPDMSDTEIRNMLAAFLFTGDDVFKRIKDLSGGERGRLSLSKLMLSRANFLILDEPTNHLDIVSKEILEDALNSYSGTVLYVSHDRYFINRTATRILDLTGSSFIDYPGYGSEDGLYDYYNEAKASRDKKGESSVNEANGKSAMGSEYSRLDVSEAKVDYLKRKEKQAAERKRENRIKRIEDEISELEDRLQEIDNEMMNPDVASNADELMRLSEEKNIHEQELVKLLDEWENLNNDSTG